VNRNLEMPALNGEVVTEFHARICRVNGHATHRENGVEAMHCPRCGDMTERAQAQLALRQAAEHVREAHHKAAAQNDGNIYAASQKAFKAILDAAYPEYGAEPLYNMWLDSMESIEYYATRLINGTIILEEWA
jgi:hypothetical protein